MKWAGPSVNLTTCRKKPSEEPRCLEPAYPGAGRLPGGRGNALEAGQRAGGGASYQSPTAFSGEYRVKLFPARPAL